MRILKQGQERRLDVNYFHAYEGALLQENVEILWYTFNFIEIQAMQSSKSTTLSIAGLLHPM